jgi:hypothetical protein
MQVCKSLDDFIRDSDRPYWVLTLSNDEQIYQDDNRYGDGDIAWKRAKSYIESNQLKVNRVDIKFRSNSINVYDNSGDTFPVNTKGLFFVNSVFSEIGIDYEYSHTRKYYKFGLLVDDEIRYKCVRVPELLSEAEGVRHLCENDCIIYM